MAEITEAIEGLTDRVFAYRIAYIINRETTMPLEIKGLKGKALKAAANLDRLNQAYDAFNEAAPAHAADVESLTPQIAALQDDLTFATQILGNSVAGSNSGAGEKSMEQSGQQQDIKDSDVQETTAEAIVDQQTPFTGSPTALQPKPQAVEPVPTDRFGQTPRF